MGKYRVSILPDKYRSPLPVGSFIVFLEPTQPTASKRSGVAASINDITINPLKTDSLTVCDVHKQRTLVAPG